MYDAIFGKSDDVHGDGLLKEEFADIEAYSQSKCVTSSPMTLVFSQKEKKHEKIEGDYGTEGVIEMVHQLVSEESNVEFEKRDSDVQGKKDANIAVDATVRQELGDKKNSEEDKTWLVRIGEYSEPIELKKSEYQRRNSTRQAHKPNPNVSGGPWTPNGKGQKVTTVFNDLKAPINENGLAEFKSWFEQGLDRSNP